MNSGHSIYVVTNTSNGLVYVGRTKRSARRWAEHLRSARIGSQHYLHRAIRAHGEDHFRFAITLSGLSLDEAKAAEIAMIATLRSNQRGVGYNLSPGGEDVETAILRSIEARAERRRMDPVGEFAKASKRNREARAKMTAEQIAQAAAKTLVTLGVDGLSRRSLKGRATLGPEGRSAAARKAKDGMSPEHRQRAARKSIETLGQDGLRERGRKRSATVQAKSAEWRSEIANRAIATMGKEGLSARAHKMWAARRKNELLDPEGTASRRSTAALKASATMGADGHRQRLLKSWATRRAKAATHEEA